MRFTTLEIAELLGTGHHGPSRPVEQAVIDPSALASGRNQLFVASAHPPPLGDTSQLLFDNLADRVPYLTERSWMGGTAVNGPSTEAMLRTMALDERGRPEGCARVGVLGGAAWATAALARAALGTTGEEPNLPPSGPPQRRECPGSERYRMPMAILNHTGPSPLAVDLNRRHRGCAAADAALLDPTVVVVTDLGDHHLATLGPDGVAEAAKAVLGCVGPDTAVVLSQVVRDALAEECSQPPRFDAAETATFLTTTAYDQGQPPGSVVQVSGGWGTVEVELDQDGGWLAGAIGGAVAAAAAGGCDLDEVVARITPVAQALTESIVVRQAEGVVVWDRSDATSVGAVATAIDVLAARPATARFLVLGAMDDGPTATGRQHARLGRQATEAGIVVQSADAWGAGFQYLEHPQLAVDDLAAAGPGAVVMLAGTSDDLLSVRHSFHTRAGRAP